MKAPTWIQVRSVLLFGTGLSGVAYETVVGQGDRPTLLIMFGAMLGLPLFLRADEKTIRAKIAKVIDLPPSGKDDEVDDDG